MDLTRAYESTFQLELEMAEELAREKQRKEREHGIRELARNYLMNLAFEQGFGTREEFLAKAMKRATLVYDDVAAFPIPPKQA